MASDGKSRIKRYAVEFGVIFLGVWMSLLAEDYRQYRIERSAERTSLERLIEDLEVDLSDMRGNLENARNGETAARWLLEQRGRTDVDQDSLSKYLTLLQSSSVFLPNTSEYTALISSGSINIFRDADFRRRLTQLYEFYDYVNVLHEAEWETELKAFEAAAPELTFAAPDTSTRAPVRPSGDPQALLANPMFSQIMAHLAMIRGPIRSFYETGIETIRELQAQARRSIHP